MLLNQQHREGPALVMVLHTASVSKHACYLPAVQRGDWRGDCCRACGVGDSQAALGSQASSVSQHMTDLLRPARRYCPCSALTLVVCLGHPVLPIIWLHNVVDITYSTPCRGAG